MSPIRIRLSALASEPAHSPVARTPARDASALKLQFLASLNHEIRTPLSGILGMSDLLLETGLDSEQRDYITALRQCAEGLFELLNDTLEYTSLSSGCLQLDEAEFHLEDALQSCLRESSERAQQSGLTFTSHCAADLPPTAIGDAYRIRQVLTLLLQYALKSALGGSIDVDITLLPGAAKPNGHGSARQVTLSVAVRTSGCGITAAAVRETFETFDQIELGDAQRFNGVSLGLALTRRVLQLLKGDMVVESVEEGTTVLTAEIPLHLPKPVLVPQAARGAQARPVSHKLLIVEDNRISQQVLRAILTKGAFEFDCVGDGLSAIQAATENPYQLILMDLQMPGMDGIEATRHIRALPGYEEIPILALTAEVSDQVRALCRQTGMNAFLNKPVHAGELLAAVQRFLPS